MGAPKIDREESGDTRCAAIDPCDLCPHNDYKDVDKRCDSCELRDRRFFEIVSIIK